MVVTRTTLHTAAWDTVYTYLQTTDAISTDNIFSAWNSTLATDKGYPLVIIFPPLASLEKVNVTGSFVGSEINFLFEIYHTSAANVKALVDEVMDKLYDGRATFGGAGLKRMNISSGGYDVWEEGKKKIHRIAFNVTFMFKQDG